MLTNYQGGPRWGGGGFLHHFEFKAFRREFEWYVLNTVFSCKGTFQSVFMALPPEVALQGFVTSTIWQEICSRQDQPIFLLLCTHTCSRGHFAHGHLFCDVPFKCWEIQTHARFCLLLLYIHGAAQRVDNCEEQLDFFHKSDGWTENKNWSLSSKRKLSARRKRKKVGLDHQRDTMSTTKDQKRHWQETWRRGYTVTPPFFHSTQSTYLNFCIQDDLPWSTTLDLDKTRVILFWLN